MPSEAVNNILSVVAGYDKSAKSKYEIDSKAEWEKLGSFLNGSVPIDNNSKTTSEKLNEEDRNYLKNIWESLKSAFENDNLKDLENDICEMMDEDKYKKKTYEKLLKSITAENIADVSLDTLRFICDNENRKPNELENDEKYIMKLLENKAKELDIEVDDVCVYDDTRKNIIHLKMAVENKEEELAKDAEIEKIKSKRNDKNDSRSELERYAQEYFVEKDGDTLIPLELYRGEKTALSFGKGWGFIDGEVSQASAQQATGNCWLMGGMNSLTTTVDGAVNKDLEALNNDIYRDQMHGVTVVRIPEAAQNHCGKDGKGIYVISDAELTRTTRLSNGDYDVAAYNLAVQQYFKEINEQGGSINGNKIERFYELRTGQKAIEFDGKNIPYGVGLTYSPDFNALYSFVQNGGKAELGTLLNPNDWNFRHGISVVGVKDGKIIVQESNNSSSFASQFPGSWQDEKGNWYIALDEKTFNERINRAATLKT